VTGTGTATYFPIWTTSTNIGDSPFLWNGTNYIFNNTALNAEFTMRLTPSVAGGRFLVGDFTTTPTSYIDLNQTTGEIFLNATGTFNAGDCATTNLNCFSVNQSTGTTAIKSVNAFTANTNNGVVRLGDILASANSTSIELNDTIQQIQLVARTVNIGQNATFFNVADGSKTFSFSVSGAGGVVDFSTIDTLQLNRTITAGGTTGNQTINKPAGTVNFAGGASAITVTNSLVTTSSIISVVARTNDATCSVKNYVPASGSFVINMTAACTAETSVGFIVTN